MLLLSMTSMLLIKTIIKNYHLTLIAMCFILHNFTILTRRQINKIAMQNNNHITDLTKQIKQKKLN